MPSSSSFQFQHRVVFAECDMAGCLHFSRIFQILEEAEQALYREANVPWITPTVGWPRVRVECNYRSPAYLDEILTCHLTLETFGQSHLEWAFTITNSCHNEENRLIAEGRIHTCYVQRESTTIRAIPIDTPMQEKLIQTISRLSQSYPQSNPQSAIRNRDSFLFLDFYPFVT